MATDPVCGMYVDERRAELTLSVENRAYYFCSSTCLATFAKPELALRRLRHRLAVGWPLSVAVLVLTYAWHFPDWPQVAFVLATVVQFYAGWRFYLGAWDAIRHRLGNMDLLIAVGTTAAYGYSTVSLFLPGSVPMAYYFDASALIVTLILTGNYLEHFTRQRAGGAVRKLQEMLPRKARVVRDGEERELPVDEVQLRDKIRVRPGERFPVDGTVLDGQSTVNEALVTGESLPVAKAPGTRVLAGTVNGEGLLQIATDRVGPDTVLAEIGRLVREAETSRIGLQKLADRIAAGFVPIVLVLGAAAGLGWWAATGVSNITLGVLVFVSVVITACPCAFGLATPAALLVGTGRAAEEGILFKGRDALEQASRVDLVLADKTGTLTRGEPRLAELATIPEISADELLGLAAALEVGSEHPLARALVEAARERGVRPPVASGLRAVAGQGLLGSVAGRTIAVRRGERETLGREPSPGLREAGDRFAKQGFSWSIVEADSRPLGLLAFTDTVAPGVPDAVEVLRQEGIPVAMVTGDQAAAAESVARTAGISIVHSGASPARKLELLRAYQSQGRTVAFVGDGINDAPALAAADVGIAIGAGTDVAREAGGIVLMRSDFRSVALALRLARKTVGRVRQNLVWALGYNAVLLPIAAGAVVPLFGVGVYGILPILGAVAMGLSSTSVVLNSFSLRWVSLRAARGAAPRAGSLAVLNRSAGSPPSSPA